MDSLLLEQCTRAILPSLRIWDGWKVRIPVNVAGVLAAVQKWGKEKKEDYRLEVGMTGPSKVNLTLLVEPDVRTLRHVEALDTAFASTARDGEIVVLAPLTWAASSVPYTSTEEQARSCSVPDMFVLRPKCEGRTLAWFVWHRDRIGRYRVIG